MISTNHMSISDTGAGGSAASNFVWKYCRMCALEVKQGVYIFGEEGRRLHIPEKIRKTVAILVLEEDTLPKKICTSCCNSLEAYTQFKDSVVDAQEKLSSIAKSIEKSQEQSQNLLHLRNKQSSFPSARSPKRPKLFHSTLSTHSTSSNNLFPAPSIISTVEPDLAEPAIECDEPPSSVVSAASSEEEENTAPNSPPEYNLPHDPATNNDELVQVSPQGHSPPAPVTANKLSVRDSKSVPSQASHECDDASMNKNSSKSPVHNGDSSTSSGNSQSEADVICGYCAYHSSDKDALLSHHSMSHTSLNSQRDPLFRCSMCIRISYNYDSIYHHLQKHRKVELFKCPDCDKSFSTKEQLNVHISSKHSPAAACSSKSFMTPLPHQKRAQPGCLSSSVSTNPRSENVDENVGATPSSSSSTSLMSSTVTKPDNLLSMSAGEKSTIPYENNEISTIQTVVISGASPTKSPEKNKTSNAVSVVNTPADPHTPESRKLVSANCKEDSGRNNTSNQSATTSEAQDGYWKCDHCDKILRSKNGYDLHMATHKGRRYTCEHCGVPYTQKSSLEHHIKVHHTNIDKEFECPECGKKFKTLRQLSWHKKTHEKPLTDVRCPQCEKTFKNMISFKTHMKLHRGSKKFPCAECPKAFYTKAKLMEHMNSHTGKRPFGCPVDNCTKVFSGFSNYSKHFKKHHHTMIGPKGSMIPQPKMVENNNNVLPVKQNEANVPKKIACATGSKNPPLPEKESVIANASRSDKSHEMTQSQATEPPPPSNEPNATVVHSNYHSQPTDNANSQAQTVLRPLPTIYSGPSMSNMSSQTPSTSSHAFSSQTSCNTIQLVPSSSNSLHSQGGTITLHSSSNSAGNENLSVAHAQSVHPSSLQNHSHHHNPNVHHPGNIHAHNNAHSAHNNHNSITGSLPHHAPLPQFQSQNHIQTVWQPVVLPNSKSYHSISTSTNLSTINSLELLDCAGPVGSSESLTHNPNNHSQLQQSSGNGNVMPTSIAAAHHATSHSSVVHAHQGISVLTSNSGNASNSHPGSIHHHGPTSGPVSHSSGSSTSHHGISVPSSSSSANVPTYGQPAQQNEPMELSYKDSNNFQEMPMELTKVFQRDPLELCVRQDYGHTQPLMDLSSRVVNVTVGGNSSLNVSTISINPNQNSSNTSSSSASQNHYNSISSGSGSTSGSILSVPYHKTVELVERELSLNDFTAFRQPIDLIARSDDQSHELCSEGNLVDLSLRSSFGQDQSASSFLRELIDLSSRSDSFHGEINLTNKQSSSSAHSQMHHSHSSNHHPIPKLASSNGNPIQNSHHHNSHHSHHHHHHHIQSHQPISSTGGPPMQAVLYTDANSIFNMQN